jgi:hypothetical protein
VAAKKIAPLAAASTSTPALPALAFPSPALVLPATSVALPAKAGVEPRIASVSLDSYVVTDVHLRPLFSTTIRLPESATSIVVGAPTLFMAEHSDDDPRLVFVKPSTHEAAESNLLIALQSGETISLKLISSGDVGSKDSVDFVLDYRSGKRLLMFAQDMGISPITSILPAAPVRTSAVTSSRSSTTPVPALEDARIPLEGLDAALSRQASIATPRWITVEDLKRMNKANTKAPNTIAISLGRIAQDGDSMVATYSILNVSNQWVQVLPPQIQLANPMQKKSRKKRGALAEQVPIEDYRLNLSKLSPGARADGVVKFSRPGFKQSREALLLQIATASAVDTPLLVPLPFVAPGS